MEEKRAIREEEIGTSNQWVVWYGDPAARLLREQEPRHGLTAPHPDVGPQENSE